MMLQFSAGAAAAAALAGVARPAGAQALPVLRIALIPGDISGEADYAKDLGYFKKAGYDVEFTPITSGAAISAAVASGAADIGFSNIISLAIAHEKGVPFTLLAPANLHVPTQVTAGILTVKKDGPIKTAKDLNGKVVAVNGLNNISSVSVQAYVDKNGGDWKSIKFIELPFPQMPEAVRSGKVDGASIDAANEQLLVKPDSDLRRLANVFDAVGSRFSPSSWFTSVTWPKPIPRLSERSSASWRKRRRGRMRITPHPPRFSQVHGQNAGRNRVGDARTIRHENHARSRSAVDRCGGKIRFDQERFPRIGIDQSAGAIAA